MTTWLSEPAVVRLFMTALLLLAAVGVRLLLVRRIMRGSHIIQENQRRQLFWLRSAVTVVVLVGLVLIWASALQNLLLSLTAVMVAVVIATKELLMCVSGFLLRTTGGLFSVGDWIECNGLRGEVTDHTLLSTRLLEVESPEHGHEYTGRTLILPNSVFLSHPVVTASASRQYVHHRFALTLEAAVDPVAGIERLQREADAAFAPFLEEARLANESLDRRLGVDVAGPEPRVAVGMSDIGKMRFTVTLFSPRTEASRLEQRIAAGFLRAVHEGEFDAGERGDTGTAEG